MSNKILYIFGITEIFFIINTYFLNSCPFSIKPDWSILELVTLFSLAVLGTESRVICVHHEHSATFYPRPLRLIKLTLQAKP